MINQYAPTKSNRWMVVDDNPDLLAMMQLLLEQLHEGPVDCFRSSPEALAAFAAAPDGYELVVTDYEMPDLDGVALCRSLLSLSPELKVILATGSGFFTDAAARHAGFSGLLSKPFPMATLRTALAHAGMETETVAYA